MHKEKLRKRYKEKRAALTQQQIESWSIAIANNCLKLAIWDFENYHLFLTIERLKEVQTHNLLSILQGKDKNVFISKSNFENNTMEHFLLNDSTRLTINSLGIPEPVSGFKIDEDQLNVVFVPLLGVDTNGNRIGYGKGFYDRFLSLCRQDAIFVGLSFFEPMNEILITDDNDVPIHFLVTPNSIYTF